MIVEKLISKRGQISMELSILVAAAVAVAAIAAYYYVTSVQTGTRNVGNTASHAITRLNETATNYINQINTSP